MKSVITAYEAVKCGPASDKYPVGLVCNHIIRKELTAFKACYLGLPFRKALIADLTVQGAVAKYVATTTYAIGDQVVYDGCVLISQIDANDVAPDDDNGTAWLPARKFVSDVYQELWDEYMKYWLSFEVIHGSIKYSTYSLGSKGATKHDGEHEKTIDYKELLSLKNELKFDTEELLDCMLEYMTEINEGDSTIFSFLTPEGVCEDECRRPDRTQRRTHYLH